MSDFMEGYGVVEERRGRMVKRLVLGGLAVIVLATSGYFYFRTWSEERIMDDFLAAIEMKDWDGAYGMWCTPEKPCPYYPKEKFLEDWGPMTPFADVSAAEIRHVDYCDSGVVFNYDWGPPPGVMLWVDRGTGVISFAPWERCPGPHLQIGPFFERLFGSSKG